MHIIKTFGRTRARPLSPNQSDLINNALEKWRLGEVAPNFDPQSLMGKDKCWFEIGFGGAEHLLGQAKNNPDVQFIGAEPFIEGIAKALRGIEDDNIENIRLINSDARPVLNALKDECIDRIFILFPDPWPKLRHHKRRLVDKTFVENLVRILKAGGQIRFASDWANYAEEALAVFLDNKDLKWCANSQNDWQKPPQDHIETRYQLKNMGDCKPQFFDFIKV